MIWHSLNCWSNLRQSLAAEVTLWEDGTAPTAKPRCSSIDSDTHTPLFDALCSQKRKLPCQIENETASWASDPVAELIVTLVHFFRIPRAEGPSSIIDSDPPLSIWHSLWALDVQYFEMKINCCQLVITFLAIVSLCLAFWDVLAKMLAILNQFLNIIFYLSLFQMLFLTSNFVYHCCQGLAALHQREERTLSTSQEISTASQTPQCNPHLAPPSLKAPLPSKRNTNPSPSQLIIDKYPHQQLKDAKNEFQELSIEKNCDFEETDPWCQCSCTIS